MLGVCFAAGIFSVGAQMSITAIVARLYPAAARGTAVGWSFSVGRLGGLVGPVLAGFLLSFGMGFQTLMILMGALSLVSASAFFALSMTAGLNAHSAEEPVRRTEPRGDGVTLASEPWYEGNATNPILERLKQGVPVTVLGIRMARTAEVARLARASGHHGHLGGSGTQQHVGGCRRADLRNGPGCRARAARSGAGARVWSHRSTAGRGRDGCHCPRIETAEQAFEVAAACRFPPLGHRSAISTLPLLQYRRLPRLTCMASQTARLS